MGIINLNLTSLIPKCLLSALAYKSLSLKQ